MIAQEEYKLHADFQAAVWKREPREIQLDFFFLFQISNFLPSLKCTRLPIKLKHMKKISCARKTENRRHHRCEWCNK